MHRLRPSWRLLQHVAKGHLQTQAPHQDASLLDQVVGMDKAGRGRLARAARSAQRLHPAGNGPPDFVRRIFLDEMDSLDRHLGLGRQAAGVFENLAAGEDSAGLGLQELSGV
jgi:hypothetical protein